MNSRRNAGRLQPVFQFIATIHPDGVLGIILFPKEMLQIIVLA